MARVAPFSSLRVRLLALVLVAERHRQAVARARGLLVGLARQPSVRAHDGPTCSAELAPILKDDPLYSNLAGVDRSGDIDAAPPARDPQDLAAAAKRSA